MRKIRPQRFGYDGPGKLPEVYYPTFNLPLKDLPEAKDIDVGGMCDLELTVRLKSRTEGEMGGNITFEIRKIALDDDDDEEEGDN